MNPSQTAVFAGGCFWCTEPVFSQLKGVTSVTSGYIGGHTTDPSYKTISNGDTGHAEGIEIVFDASQINFETLLAIFFTIHDPTTLNRQGNDVGTQYRSAIFCQSDEQKTMTRTMIEALEQAGTFDGPIVTEVNDSATFYPAEDYHQAYFAKNPTQPYCLAVSAPKIEKIRAKYPTLIKPSSSV